MAKVKNKRNSGLADKVHDKKKSASNKKKVNPFEVHINREKNKVLGKKSKHDRGLPGVSRAKAIQKRKETLGAEMKLVNKTNTFIDRRIGEKDSQLSSEERMVARFAAERVRQHGKRSIYNLADDEILTHRGQTLEQIEKFDDPRSSDDEEEDGKKFGGLGDEFVSEGHFGGGMLSKSGADGAKSHKDLIEQLIAESKKRKVEKQKEKEQTLDLTEKLDSEWKDLQPVVFKRARVEEKEGPIDKLLAQADQRGQDYDKMMRELKFEKRGTPSDGLKTDEKQSKEERLRLEQLERERMQRMLGESETATAVVHKSAPKHRSADDLDDNFELEDEKEFMLAYDKDGKPLVPDHVLKDYSVPNSKPKFEDGVSDTSSEDGDDDDDENDQNEETNDKSDESSHEESDDNEDVQADTEKDSSLIRKPKVISEGSEESSSDDDDVEEEVVDNKVHNKKDQKKKITAIQNTNDAKEKLDKTNIQKNIAKLKKSDQEHSDESSEDSEEQDVIEDNISKTKQKKTAITQKSNKKQSEESSEDDEESTLIGENLKTTKKNEGTGILQNPKNVEADEDEGDSSNEESEEEIEETKNFEDLNDLKMSDGESEEETEIEDEERICSFFDLKAEEGENLTELLTGKTPSQQSTVIQKLIKKYDPGLAENNKDKLNRLYAHMLQYTNDIFSNLKNEGDVLKSFLIFDKIAPLFYDLAHTNKVSTKKFLVELLKEKRDRFKKNRKKIPDLDTLVFFKLVSLLYPTSDYRHPVTTISLIFMSEILAQSKFNDAHSISRGLFLTSLVLEYTYLSKRYVPSAVIFLRGLLYLSSNTTILNPIQVVPPFKLHRDAKILNLEDDCSKMAAGNKMAAKDFVVKNIDNDFKIRCLFVASLQLKEYFNNCNDLDAQASIFEPHLKVFSRIDLELYPKEVAMVVQKVIQHMKESLEVKTLTPLSREKKKPKALRLYEPDVQEVFTGSKSSKLSREQASRARLQRRLKSEMKGAIREIRRDKAYIAGVKIRQKIASDNVRKEKVKQIYKDASIQQGELNKLKRIK